MLYSIQIGNASAKNWVQFAYDFKLNSVSNFQTALDGVTAEYLTQYDTDNEINIYRNGSLEFRGIITSQKSLIGGGVVLSGLGIEIELTDNKAPMVGSAISRVWTSESDNTIINTLVTSVTGWTTNVTNSTSTTLTSFRTTASESVWNAIISLISQTGKDIYIDQANKIVYLYDELTRESQFSFIEGKNASDITRTKSRSKAGKVIVYGKGDGEIQIIGSSGTGTPVETVIDRNIITTTEANARALTEYNKLNPNPKSYTLKPLYSEGLRLGDSGNIASNSAKINEEVDLVRIKRVVSNLGKEDISIEVTNPQLRVASKTRAEELNKQIANYRQSQSSMQGSGNTLNWDRGINAKSGASSKLVFYIPENFIYDEAGNIRVNSMTLDYDVDPYRSNIGTATTDAHAHSLTPGATDSHKHDVTNSSTHPHGIPATTAQNQDLFEDEGSDSSTSFSASAGWNYDVCQVFYNGTYSFMVCKVIVKANFSEQFFEMGISIEDGDGTFILNRFNMGANTDLTSYVIREYMIFPIFASANRTINLNLYSDSAKSYDVYLECWGFDEFHNHSIATFNSNGANANVADSNKTPSLTGNSENTSPSVTIGDDVSEAGTLNATQVNIYLDYWDGSSWINKYSILNTGVTIDKDVDLTNSGTYPDSFGWWRARVEPDSTIPDYVQSIVKLKHNLEN